MLSSNSIHGGISHFYKTAEKRETTQLQTKTYLSPVNPLLMRY